MQFRLVPGRTPTLTVGLGGTVSPATVALAVLSAARSLTVFAEVVLAPPVEVFMPLVAGLASTRLLLVVLPSTRVALALDEARNPGGFLVMV